MENNEIKKGGISVETEHIFPVIKKWLYSDKEIFLREIVSNACDAVTKLRRLESLGQYDSDGEQYYVKVTLDADEKTLTVSDNGIGMNAEEVENYLCKIALSGAVDFIKKYEGENTNSGIIGHFGLGFYSAFMVSDRVEVITRSKDGSAVCHLVCTDSGEYTLDTETDLQRTHGTDVVMHISDEGEEYLKASEIRRVLDKYCSFMPVDIFFDDGAKEDTPAEDSEGSESDSTPSQSPVNDTHPLWLKNPSECTDEEYIAFYHKVFSDFADPLFWIHINADYPLNFKGILYFPPIRPEFDSLEGQVKLYYNQVFVADNIKEVIPEYLLMLRGVLDCPELPLNVSRSYLQNNTYVTKVSNHIIKKVSDKINSLFNTKREDFEGFWDKIKIFVEYGCLRDSKFFERTKNSLLLATCDNKYTTANEYLENAKEKHEGKIYYATDKVSQAQYISMFQKKDIGIVLMNGPVDMQFMSLIEKDKNVKFLRIDSELADLMKGEGEAAQSEELASLFKKVSGLENLTVSFEVLDDSAIPALLNIPEDMRRYEDMMKYYAPDADDGMSFAMSSATLIVNTSNEIIKKLEAIEDADKKERSATQIWSLSLLAQRQLSADELCRFLDMSYKTLSDSL